MENPFINYWLWYYDVLWRYWPIVVVLTIIAVWLMYRRYAKRQVLLFIDADVPDGSRDNFRYRTAIVDEEDNGNKIFVVPGAKYVPNNKLWWRDLIPPERAKHYNEGNSK